jgi:hypothetical protein
MSELELRLQAVSEFLPDILDRLVFVGGGVTELLITDSAGRKPRPTEDVDCIVEVASRVEYYKIEERLRKAGFLNDPTNPPVICRWVKGPLILDVMPTLEGILGFTNIWYKDAVGQPLPHALPNGLSVNIIHPVYYVATKTEAFRNRGRGNYRTSHDFEDIVALLNGRAELVLEMKSASPHVLKAMRDYWLPRMESANFKASIREHLDAYEDIERTPLIIERFRQMLE